MTQILFTRGIHARPFSTQLNAAFSPVEFDYGGLLTSYSLLTSLWPVVGVDLSYWQSTLNGEQLAKKAQFAILRYCYGNGTVDGKLSTFYPELIKNGIVPMAYHYVKAGKDPKKHVETFTSLLKDYPAIAIFGDVEEDGGLSKNELNNWLTKYFLWLSEEWQSMNSYNEDQARKTMGIYTSPGFWNAEMPLTSWAKWLMLWDAHWTTANTPIIPTEWANKGWYFWQWSSKGAGVDYGVGSKYVDLNRYNGSVDAFNNQFKTNIKPLGDDIPLPPVEEEFPKTVSTTAYSLNIRTQPVVSDTTKIGSVGRGTKFETVGLAEQDKNWYRLISYGHKNYFEDA